MSAASAALTSASTFAGVVVEAIASLMSAAVGRSR